MKGLKFSFLLLASFLVFSVSVQAQSTCQPKDCDPKACTPEQMELCKKICDGKTASADIDFTLKTLVSDEAKAEKKGSCKPVCGKKKSESSASVQKVNLVKENTSPKAKCQPSDCAKKAKKVKVSL